MRTDPRRATAIVVLALLLPATAPTGAEARLARHTEEREVARLVTDHPLQGRSRLTHDARLHLVARAKAEDMARRDYFGHVDPDGIGPNHVVRLTGYRLPDFYPTERWANSIESITAGTDYTPKMAFRAWMNSPGHRRHLLASQTFYQQQTRFGVGYARSPGSRYKNYYVFISAPPSAKKLSSLQKVIINLFLTRTPRQIEKARGDR